MAMRLRVIASENEKNRQAEDSDWVTALPIKSWRPSRENGVEESSHRHESHCRSSSLFTGTSAVRVNDGRTSLV